MSSSDKTVKVAVVQASPVILNSKETIDKVEKLCIEAGCKGAKAELVLFPEAFVSCYPRGSNFGAVIGSRTAEGRELFRLYWQSSIDIPGPTVQRLGNIAKENRIHLVIGVIERDGGTLYCTVISFDDQGNYLGKHRKLMPTAAERVVWGFGDGSTLPVFHTKLGKIGAAICWENYMPMLRMSLYSKGIEIYCAPTADTRDSWISSMKHIAVEGRCFVLSCNQFVKKSDYPEKFSPLDLGSDIDADSVLCRGGSCIVDPFGEILAGPHYEGETILYADLDMNQILRGKFDFDPVGHYSRPDVFQLIVNERNNQPVSVIGTTTTDSTGSTGTAKSSQESHKNAINSK